MSKGRRMGSTDQGGLFAQAGEVPESKPLALPLRCAGCRDAVQVEEPAAMRGFRRCKLESLRWLYLGELSVCNKGRVQGE
jgi:hypothetical protein